MPTFSTSQNKGLAPRTELVALLQSLGKAAGVTMTDDHQHDVIDNLMMRAGELIQIWIPANNLQKLKVSTQKDQVFGIYENLGANLKNLKNLQKSTRTRRCWRTTTLWRYSPVRYTHHCKIACKQTFAIYYETVAWEFVAMNREFTQNKIENFRVTQYFQDPTRDLKRRQVGIDLKGAKMKLNIDEWVSNLIFDLLKYEFVFQMCFTSLFWNEMCGKFNDVWKYWRRENATGCQEQLPFTLTCDLIWSGPGLKKRSSKVDLWSFSDAHPSVPSTCRASRRDDARPSCGTRISASCRHWSRLIGEFFCPTWDLGGGGGNVSHEWDPQKQQTAGVDRDLPVRYFSFRWTKK